MKVILIMLFVGCFLTGFSQERGIDTLDTQPSLTIDSIDTNNDSLLIDTPKAKKTSFKGPLSMFSGRPGRAALYSLLLPGAGQYYNKKYWKVPFFLIGEGVAVAVLVHNNKVFKLWNNCLNNYTTVCGDGRNQDEVKSKRDNARQFRDYAIIAVAVVHLVQVADAFVNRHLIEFDVSDDLSLDLRSTNLGPALGFTWTF